MTQDKDTFSGDAYDNDRKKTLVQHVEKAARNNNDFKDMKNIDLVSIFNKLYSNLF